METNKQVKKPTYYQDQIDGVINDTASFPDYKMKIIGPHSETKWMNITQEELKKIRRIMRRE